jgi:ABC-2 type transport system ATP-binding protein
MSSASAPTTLALDIRNVSHAFGARRALDGVDISVAQSSFTVLLGLNGAGKSTLFSLITRLYATRSGHIRIFGRDVAREPGEALRRLGVVFQSRALDMDISVQQNLRYNAALHGMGGREAIQRTNLLLRQVGLADRAHDRVADLSGGQVRRVEIARALLHRPRLLLLDEPTAGLDIKSRADILRHVRQLLEREGVGVLWATHLIDEVEPDDDVVVLHQGRVRARGSVAEILAATGRVTLRAAFASLTGMDDGDEAGGAR